MILQSSSRTHHFKTGEREREGDVEEEREKEKETEDEQNTK